MEDDRAARTACHWALLRLAGLAPDDRVAKWRGWLANGHVLDAVRAVVHTVGAYGVRLTDQETSLITDLLTAGGVDGATPPAQDGVHLDRVISYGFAASHALMDMALTSSGPLHPDLLIAAAKSEGGVDDAIVAAMNAEPHVRAVWRGYRFPIGSSRPPSPVRVFVIETDRDADLPEITGRIQDALAAAGEEPPRVEVYPVQAEPPPYQRCARLAGGLIWARVPDPGIHISQVFDAVEDDGEVRMAPDHPRLDATESRRVLIYLDQGEELLISPSRVADIVDPTRGAAVPITLRTDGYWIWSDAIAYYLRRYALAPEPELMAHIKQRGYTAPEEVDGAAMYRALVALYTFGAEKSSIR